MTEAELLRAWREFRDWTQTECATRVGVTRSAWNQWERGKAMTIANLRACAKAFRVSMKRFYSRPPVRRPRRARATR
jgi:transcriptional regulator with XRE-family HTH domain